MLNLDAQRDKAATEAIVYAVLAIQAGEKYGDQKTFGILVAMIAFGIADVQRVSDAKQLLVSKYYTEWEG